MVAAVVRTMDLACRTGVPRIVCLAVDSLHKLVAFGFASGWMPQDSTSTDSSSTAAAATERVRVIDAVVDTVAAQEGQRDAAVQLAVLKACLTAVTAPTGDLHEAALMRAFRACFDLHLAGATPLVAATATGILRQAVHHVFAQYEIAGAAACAARRAARAAARQRHAAFVELAHSLVSSIFDEVVGVSVHNQEQKQEQVQGQGNQDRPMGAEVQGNQSGSLGAEKEMTKEQEQQEEQEEEEVSHAVHENSVATIAYQDCVMLFRALCRLSTHEADAGAGAREQAQAARCRALALELLYAVVERGGPVLRADRRFTEAAVRRQLCGALVRNGVSANARIFRYSLAIFYSLTRHYRAALKTEIGVFFSNILLRVLESPNSTVHHKWMVLQLLAHVCRDPRALADLYINYDCDLHSRDILVRIVDDLAKIAQGAAVPGSSSSSSSSSPLSSSSSSSSAVSPAQELAVKSLGLECIVLILQSLVSWIDGDEQTQQQQEVSQQQQRSITPARSPAVTPSPVEDASLTSPLGANADEGEDPEVARFKQMKQQKQRIEYVKAKWMLDAKQAVACMRQFGMCDDTPASLAHALRGLDGLDKRALGDFLGGSKELNKAVLREYVHCFEFAGMELDEALRAFLGTFLLPGEGQVVDRIMENFGCRYFECNKSDSESNESGSGSNSSSSSKGKAQFADADAVYKLSFAIIMLATDLHNPKVKDKLTFAQWVKMVNKDLCLGLDEQYLRAVHDRIAAREFELLDTGSSAGSSTAREPRGSEFLSARQRGARFEAETSRWVDASMREMSARRREGAAFYHARETRVVKPVFESIWGSTAVALSVLLEENDAPRVVEACLAGFRAAVHIAAVFGMDTERTTLVAALGKCTRLGGRDELRPKNVAAVRTLIAIATADGDRLRGSWCEVLQAISLLERLHLIGAGLKPDVLSTDPSTDPFAGAASQTAVISQLPLNTSGGSSSGGVGKHSPSRGLVAAAVAAQEAAREELDAAGLVPQPPFTLEVSAAEAASSRAVRTDVDPASVERVFAASAALSDTAIVDFVRALCQVSLAEVRSATPRTYSLQRLVEVAAANMDQRIRLVWREIWLPLERHLIVCGCHPLSAVSVYTVDALRQLAARYLEKDELANYNFQRDFLRPFAVVAASTASPAVQEYVLQCVRQLVLARTRNLRSGWKTVFEILGGFADPGNSGVSGSGNGFYNSGSGNGNHGSPRETCMVEAYELLVEISQNLFEAVWAQEHFEDLVGALVRFARSEGNARVSADAVARLRACAERAAPRVAGGEGALRAWFPVLTGLSGVVAAHPAEAVRAAALRALGDLLRAHGGAFTGPVWVLVFRGALLPMFDAVGYCRGALAGDADPEWRRTTCAPALAALGALVRAHRDVLAPALLPELLALPRALVVQGSPDLVRHGVAAFATLVADCAPVLDAGAWAAVANTASAIIEGAATRTYVLLSNATSGFSIVHGNGDDSDDDDDEDHDGEEKEKEKEEKEEDNQTNCAYCGKTLPLSTTTTGDGNNESEQEQEENIRYLCPLCDDVVYCSSMCQRAHWSVHRAECLRTWTQRHPMPHGPATTSSTTQSTPLPPMRSVVLTPREDFAVARMPNSPGSRALVAVGLSTALVRARCEAVETVLRVVAEHGLLSTTDTPRGGRAGARAVLNALAAGATAGAALLAGARARSLLEEWEVLAAIAAVQQHTLARCVEALPRDAPRFFALCADVLATLGDADAPDLLCTVLAALLALDEAAYTAHARQLYPALTALIDSPEARVRALVRKHFVRIGQAFHLL